MFVFCADFMAALSDPRAFLSAQEKRTAQMEAMGIEATAIDSKDIIVSTGKKGSKSGPKGGGAAAKPEEKKEGTLVRYVRFGARCR